MKEMMVKASIMMAAAAMLGALAQAATQEENHFDNEKLIIDGLEKMAASEGKFNSYEHHLGMPAMHSELQDGKFSNRRQKTLRWEPVRIHQTANL